MFPGHNFAIDFTFSAEFNYSSNPYLLFLKNSVMHITLRHPDTLHKMAKIDTRHVSCLDNLRRNIVLGNAVCDESRVGKTAWHIRGWITKSYLQPCVSIVFSFTIS